MATIATIDMLLRAQTAQFSRDMKKARSDITGLKTSATSAAAGLGRMAAAYLSFQLVKSQVASTFKEMEEDAKATRKVEAALTATGHSARLSGEQLKAMASDFQTLSNFEDDAILNAEAMLLTFRNIKGDNFKSTMQAALDLSAALDKDLNSSVMQLGKALNDPVRGLTQLRKVGIQFSEQQKQQVKDFMAAGNAAAAQKVILDQLAQSYGGQSVASTKTLTGEVQALKEAWDALKISMLEPITPGITAGIKELTNLLQEIRDKEPTNIGIPRSPGVGSGNKETFFKSALEANKKTQQELISDNLQRSRKRLMGLEDWKMIDANNQVLNDLRAQAEFLRQRLAAASAAVRPSDKAAGTGLTALLGKGIGSGSAALLGGTSGIIGGLNKLGEVAREAQSNLDAFTKTTKEYGKVVQDTRTPAESFKKQMDDLQSLFGVVNDPQTHLRALKKARQDLVDSARGDTPAALERGTAGAFAATRKGTGDPIKNVDKNTLELVKKADAQIRLLEEQVRQGRKNTRIAEAKF